MSATQKKSFRGSTAVPNRANTNTNTKYTWGTGQTRNKLLEQWVHLPMWVHNKVGACNAIAARCVHGAASQESSPHQRRRRVLVRAGFQRGPRLHARQQRSYVAQVAAKQGDARRLQQSLAWGRARTHTCTIARTTCPLTRKRRSHAAATGGSGGGAADSGAAALADASLAPDGVPASRATCGARCSSKIFAGSPASIARMPARCTAIRTSFTSDTTGAWACKARRGHGELGAPPLAGKAIGGDSATVT